MMDEENVLDVVDKKKSPSSSENCDIVGGKNFSNILNSEDSNINNEQDGMTDIEQHEISIDNGQKDNDTDTEHKDDDTDNEQKDNDIDNKQKDNENKNDCEETNEENTSQMSLEEETEYSIYKELIALDDVNLVENTEAFVCEICLTECEPKAGIILTECLHQFCKQCITNIVVLTDDVEIKCPYRNADYCCDEIIQHREIRNVVGDIIFNEFLKRSLSLAEAKIQNSMHCQSPDCNGWAIVEACNSFICPICQAVNCVACKGVHDPRILSCAEYLRTLDNPSSHSEAVLDNMIYTRQAMKCPSCRIVIEKTAGCDGMQCTRCKTPICWATKGPRWGPGGVGDTSGGCRCKTNGRKCHQNCNNCH